MRKFVKIFAFAYGQDRGADPPPLTVNLTIKYPFFYDSPKQCGAFFVTYKAENKKNMTTLLLYIQPFLASFRMINPKRATSHKDTNRK